MSDVFKPSKELIEDISKLIKPYEFSHEKILSNNEFKISKIFYSGWEEVVLENFFKPWSEGAKVGDYAEIIPTAFAELRSLMPNKFITLAYANENSYFPNFNHVIFLVADESVMNYESIEFEDVFNDEGELDKCRWINPLVVDVVLKNVGSFDKLENKYHLDTLIREVSPPFAGKSLDLKMKKGNYTPLAFSFNDRTKKRELIYLAVGDDTEKDLLQIGLRECKNYGNYISFYSLNSGELDDVLFRRNFYNKNFEKINGLPPREDVLKYVNFLRNAPVNSVDLTNHQC